MQFKRSYIILSNIFLLAFLVYNCSEKVPEFRWDYTDEDIIIDTKPVPDSISINIFLDGTLSMIGYVSDIGSIYNKFLDDLELAVFTGWRKVDVNFYKFGSKIKTIDRAGYRQAKLGPFYREPGIFELTHIDAVIEQMDIANLNIIITDLFQDEIDVNKLILAIKEKCFQEQISVGILGIKSEFDGIVYDAKVPPYRLRSVAGRVEDTYRPFYVMVFGDFVDINHFFDSIKSNPNVMEENFVIISNMIINSYHVNITKHPESKDLTLRSKVGKNQFNFNLKKGANEGGFLADISFDRNTRTPELQDTGFELIGLRKAVVSGDQDVPLEGAPTRDISLQETRVNNNKISATLNLNLKEPKGTYSYMLYIQPSFVDGFMVPQWVKDFSSDNPRPEKDANKTLYLERFISDLIRANSSVEQPIIAKIFIKIKKL